MNYQIVWISLFSIVFTFEIICLNVKKIDILSGFFIFPIAMFNQVHFNSIYL